MKITNKVNPKPPKPPKRKLTPNDLKAKKETTKQIKIIANRAAFTQLRANKLDYKAQKAAIENNANRNANNLNNYLNTILQRNLGNSANGTTEVGTTTEA